MKVDALVAEIGSTTTVVNAFDQLNSEHPIFLGQGFSPTTVEEGDVRIGLNLAIESLKESLGIQTLEYQRFYASSSAAGGLKMTVHGLVYDMTVKAAKEAVLGAGGNIKWVTSGRLTQEDLEEIEWIKPNLIFVSGGLDYGERETALQNILQLSERFKEIPMIYAGNCVNHTRVKGHFERLGTSHNLYIAENVYPKIDTLNVQSARQIIQDAFEKNITHAGGMQKIRDLIKGKVLPTPGAVMIAAQLLEEVYGDLVVLDLGGATTDVHSVTNGDEQIAKISLAPEPKAKRTVEGDLGVYVNANHLLERVNRQVMSDQLNIPETELLDLIEQHIKIPRTPIEVKYIQCLAGEALQTAISRHVGTMTHRYNGANTHYAEGKDLTKVKVVIGTGGVLTRLEGADQLIKKSMKNLTGKMLLPESLPNILIDRDYIMASLGVLAQDFPQAARLLLINSLK